MALIRTAIGTWLHGPPMMKPPVVLLTAVTITLLFGGILLTASPQLTSHSTTSPDRALSQPTQASTKPAIGTPTITPSVIPINTPTPVVITATITDPTLIPNSVNLLLLGTTGTRPTVLRAMQTSGGGTYSAQVSFTESTAGQVQLEVSAAFRGRLKRGVSPPVQLSAWPQVVTDPATHTVVSYPPGWNVVHVGSMTKVVSQAAPGPLTDVTLSTYGSFEVEVLTNANPTQSPIQDWYSAHSQDAFSTDPLSTNVTVISGHTAVAITTAELGQWTHYFIASGTNIIHIAFGPDSDTLRTQYQQMLSTVTIR